MVWGAKRWINLAQTPLHHALKVPPTRGDLAEAEAYCPDGTTMPLRIT